MRRSDPRQPLPVPRPPARAVAGSPPQIVRPAEARDTMQAWERFVTGDPRAPVPERNFVVASWMRSREHGIDPSGRAAPIAAEGDAFAGLRERHAPLLSAAHDILGDMAELFTGTGSILLITSADGIVLEIVGDPATLARAETIHLMRGGDWREGSIGTNGIGTALATSRPAQVHAAEHFCEGIKAWTCAACPVLEPGSGNVLGVVDISGPPSTYQRNNLTLAVAVARQIEGVLAARMAKDHARLLEACLERLSGADLSGMIALDRSGRLVHAAGRVQAPVPIGQRLPGLGAETRIEDWPRFLPEGWRAEWFNPVALHGRTIGALLVVPERPRALAPRSAERGSEADPQRSAFEHVIGRSPALIAVLARARLLADKHVPVLIEGETGVGKELLARAIHGRDEKRPFVVYNCGAATKDLVAGDLFGHVRGAFTGATSEGRPGRFELAHGGTLCLDEIGELPLETQPFLLRVLEEGVLYRLGDGQPRRVEVRLLALTNRDLLDEVAAGRFRRDLYYRIGVTRLRAPPLREREDDVLLLAAHFGERLARRHGMAPRPLARDAAELFRRYAWPGNVRELRNVVESLLLMASGEVTAAEAAPLLDDAARAGARTARGTAASLSLEAAEQETVAQALRDAGGNLADAARRLGISRSTLYRKMERFQLPH